MDMLSLTNGTRAGLLFGVAGPPQPGTPVSVALQCADFSETLEQALGAIGGMCGCLIHRGFNLLLQPLFLKGVATAD